MVNPIPDNVKQVLSGLSTQQQAVLGAYIASLREEIKDYESAGLKANDNEDPHAHYHGHEKCTFDHSHGTKSHEEGEPHHKNCTEDHSRAHGHHHEESQEQHDHDCDAHKEKHHGHDHGHGEHKEPGHDGAHEHAHAHSHEHAQTTNEVPAWKKRALEVGASDPVAAPFGGTWTTEASLSATDDKMKE
jgi:sirohydrochlorin cobaltochelatase